MKALVTGIAGFTGRYVAQALTRRGISVVGLAQSAEPVEHVERVYATDVTEPDALREVVLAERPDYVVHLAAISFVVHDDVYEIYQTNLLGTRNVLEALTALETAPRAILMASSSNVYGNRNEGILRESMPPDPVNDYSVSKLAAEMVAGLYRSRLPVCVVRPFNYTGVGQSPTFLIPKIVEHVRAGEKRIRLGNLEVARDLSDVRFVSEAYCRLLQCPAAVGRTVNVSSGRAFGLDEILNMVESISGSRLDVEVDPALVRENEVRKLWGDSSLLDQLIGPIERIPLEETLRWMLDA
ncbi:MAG: GDP-mannose 4,6-dehydratase [Sphingomicrobium sp.]